MQVVAGLSLKNLKPRVWDANSLFHLPGLQAVMVSYADFYQMPAQRLKAMEHGLHAYLQAGKRIAIYLDNGAYYFLSKGGDVPRKEYEDFVREALPDWYAIPQDYIPTPHMSSAEQQECLRKTMEVNRTYGHDGYVPIIHVSHCLDDYLQQFVADQTLHNKPAVGLGGIVPNLLRASKAMPYEDVLESVRRVRAELTRQQLHVFGVGGTATLHLARLLNVDSVDSSGWRNRAARGIVQMSGCGDRVVAKMGSWRGREPDGRELEGLAACDCPACRRAGLTGLRAAGIEGFCNRAAHNLWTLLQESRQIEAHLADGTYQTWYKGHLDNSIYFPLIRRALSLTRGDNGLPP